MRIQKQVDTYPTQTIYGARRIRTADPQPVDGWIDVLPTDIPVWLALHVHGPLSSTILKEFWPNVDDNTFKKRLTKWYNGVRMNVRELARPVWDQVIDEYGNVSKVRRTHTYDHVRYLARPPEIRSLEIGDPTVYDLLPLAAEELKARGLWYPCYHRTDYPLHRFMGASLGASEALVAPKKKGLRYVPRHEALGNKKMQLSLSATLEQKHYLPDNVSALEYLTNLSWRVFADEWDRNSENLAVIFMKIDCQFDVMRRRAYFKEWSYPGLMFRWYFTSPGRMKTAMAYAHRKDPKLAERLIFKCYPVFGTPIRIPGVIENILDPYYQAGGGMLDITSPLP